MIPKTTLNQRIITFQSVIKLIRGKELHVKYPAFVPILDELTAKLEKINSLPLYRGYGKDSKTKKEIKREASQAAHVISCAVAAYAHITGNVVLKNAVQYSFSDFYRAKDEIALGRCRQMLNAAKKIQNPGNYGLTNQVLEKCTNSIRKYAEFVKKPMQEVKQTARATRQVTNLLDECLHIVQTQLDPLMVVVSQSEKHLEIHYRIDRAFRKASGRKRKYVRKKIVTHTATAEIVTKASEEKENYSGTSDLKEEPASQLYIPYLGFNLK